MPASAATPSPTVPLLRGPRMIALQDFAAALLATLVFHGGALRAGFLADDWFLAAPRTWGESLAAFAGDWNRGEQHVGGFYRPLVRLVFQIEESLWRGNAAGYHATNLWMLAAVAWLVGWLVRRATARRALGVLASMVYVTLPPLTEPAWWISGRTDLLAALGVLGALAAWWAGVRDAAIDGIETVGDRTNFPPIANRIGAFALLFAGLLSKEIAVCGLVLLPLLAALLAWDTLGPEAPADDRAVAWRRWTRMVLAPAMLLGLAYLALRWSFLGGAGGYRTAGAPPLGLDAFADTARRFFSVLAWPAGRNRGDVPLLDGKLWSALILATAALLALLAAWRFPRAIAFALLAIVVSVLPMAGLGVAPLDGGRYIVLPGAFAVLLGAQVFSRIHDQRGPLLRLASWIVLALYCASWMPAQREGASRWATAHRHNSLAIDALWKELRALPAAPGSAAPLRIAIRTPAAAHRYQAQGAASAATVAIEALALRAGWKTQWSRAADSWPEPIDLTRPDGTRLRVGLGLAPDLAPGALVFTISPDGTLAKSRITARGSRVWNSQHIAAWKSPGALHTRLGIADAGVVEIDVLAQTDSAAERPTLLAPPEQAFALAAPPELALIGCAFSPPVPPAGTMSLHLADGPALSALSIPAPLPGATECWIEADAAAVSSATSFAPRLQFHAAPMHAKLYTLSVFTFTTARE